MQDTSSGKTNGSCKRVKATANFAKTVKFDARTLLPTVGTGRTATKYPRKKVVFRQGDPADAVFYIQSGKIQLSVVSEHDKQAVAGILAAGEFFGEGCLAGQPLYQTAVIETR